jgi:hypothetical protein
MTPMTLSIGRAPEVIKHFEVKPDLERILIQDSSSNRNFVRIVAENGPFAIVPKHNSYICCCNPIARKIWTDSLEKRARIVFIMDDKTDVTEEVVDWVFPIQQQFKIEDKVHGILPVPTNLERVSTEKSVSKRAGLVMTVMLESQTCALETAVPSISMTI